MRTLWGRLVCWLSGTHNLGDSQRLPPGWSTQTCRTCGEKVQAFGRGPAGRGR